MKTTILKTVCYEWEEKDIVAGTQFFVKSPDDSYSYIIVRAKDDSFNVVHQKSWNIVLYWSLSPKDLVQILNNTWKAIPRNPERFIGEPV